MTARDSFNGALADLLLAGRMPACADSGAWTSEDAAERAAVAPLCRSCPLLAACRALAAEERPLHGVWAGVDHSRTVRARRPRKAKTA